ELVQGRFQGDVHESAASALYDALGCVSDKRALDTLKDLEATAKYHSQLPYVRARARHGDPWAIKELLTALAEPEKTSLLRKGWYSQDDAATALVWVDTAEATAALKRYVRVTWPTRTWGPFSEARAWSSRDLENYAGPSRRSTPLAEIARREPRWLAELALEQMAAPTLLARVTGAGIFRPLTGRLFDYKAEAFASERVEPLKRVAAWWAAHKTESREAWLLSYFREKGFAMTRLGHRESLPTLVRALEADFFTHNLAVEQ